MRRVTLPTSRFTVDEFFRLVEADAFGTERVELLNGRMHFMPPQALKHMVAMTKGNAALARIALTSDWVIFQGTLILDTYSAPDPDLLLLPVPVGTPVHLWPQPVLIIEVSDSTYRKDSGLKLRKYAAHGMPEYWIENLRADRVEVYRDPQSPTGHPRDCRYTSVTHYVRGQTIALAQRPGAALRVDELLP